jgi:WD40 repeat protein
MSILDKEFTPPPRHSRRRLVIILSVIVVAILAITLFTDVRGEIAFVVHFVTAPNHFTYHGHTDYVSAVAWSPDGSRIASASGDHTVQVWDATGGGHVYTYYGHATDALTLAWSPGGKYLASGSLDTTVQVWNATNGDRLYTYHGHNDAVFDVAWSPDGTRIASARSPDGKRIVIGGLGDAILLDAGTARPLGYYGYHGGTVHSVAWSPDGNYIATGRDDTTVQVWNVATTKNVYTYTGHTTDVFTVAWSPDGKRIASGSADGLVQVWDALTGNHVYTYRGHADYYWGHFTSGQAVDTMAWSPNGKRIASGGNDMTVQVWQAM